MPSYPSFLALAPREVVCGEVRLPGSKSISNRALLLASLASGVSTLKGVLAAEDTEVMLNALKTLGITYDCVSHNEGGATYQIKGNSGLFKVQQADLFLGNAGTALRPLLAVLATQPEADYRLYGVARMQERPIGDLVDALNAAGANILYEDKHGFPPVSIRSGAFSQHEIAIRGNVSSQFLTALLLAAPLLAKNEALTIRVEGPLISATYVDITCKMMSYFGVTVAREDSCFKIAKGQNYRLSSELSIEGDASNASYFLAMGAITGSPITIKGLGKNSIQGDLAFARLLEQGGIPLKWGDDTLSVEAHDKIWQGQEWDCIDIPDAAMTLAVMALFAEGNTTLKNIGSWRVKETDRIEAMAAELSKLGARVTVTEDSLDITAPEKMTAATIDTYDDHRMAMCFSLASLVGLARSGASVGINEPACVAKTYPHYFDDFLRITAAVPLSKKKENL